MSLKSSLSKRGQGTVEYLLLLAVIVAGLTAARNAMLQPLNTFFEAYVLRFSNTQNTKNSAADGGRTLQSYYSQGTSPQPTAEIKVK